MIVIVYMIITISTYILMLITNITTNSVEGLKRKLKVKISLIPPIIFTRYDVNGFVEELPQLPENRYAHACSALPATGVRPAQPIL